MSAVNRVALKLDSGHAALVAVDRYAPKSVSQVPFSERFSSLSQLLIIGCKRREAH